MKHRLPRRVHLGGGYYVKVLLVSPKVLLEQLEEDDDEKGKYYDGFFIAEYGYPCFGTIYVNNKLKRGAKWETYFHELIHAVNDLGAWTKDHPLAT